MVPPVEIDENEAAPFISAVKTGPTGRTILLPADEVAAYETLIDSIDRKFQPESYLEKLLAQSIVDSEWRLRRISSLEGSLYAIGRKELAAERVSETDPQRRAALVDRQVLAVYQKDFKRLAQQERYLRKQLKADTAELNQLLRDTPRPNPHGLFLVPRRQKSQHSVWE